jgi:hypothetical protein
MKFEHAPKSRKRIFATKTPKLQIAQTIVYQCIKNGKF